jgi:hypothetical protein
MSVRSCADLTVKIFDDLMESLQAICERVIPNIAKHMAKEQARKSRLQIISCLDN